MKTALKTLAAASFIMLLVSFQLIHTQIAVTVRDELGNTVEAAKVVLYENEEDYNSEKNQIGEGLTDAKGVVKFRDLKPMSYFLLVKKDDKDNAGGGEQTGKLDANRINKVTVVIQ